MKNNETSRPTEIYRKDYKAPEFLIDTVHLEFHIISPSEVTLINQFTARRVTENSTASLLLDGESVELMSILLDGKPLPETDYTLDEESLTIKDLPNTFELTITTKFNPEANKQLSGLYFADGIFCTQCESSGFRRMTYFMDHPDVLSRYTVEIHADPKKYPVQLSNGNCIARDENSVTWEDPFKKPAYLFALVVGDLTCIQDHFVTQSGREILLEIYVDHDNKDKCSHAMESLKNAMRWDEERFGLEYDLDIYMIVAVRSFNMGAMENKGLNIFNSKYVLGLPESATDTDFNDIERVIGHEYFHNWTGNRVTCRDWFQLSLKEGLTVFRDQEFSQYMQKSNVFRIQTVKTLRSRQFSEDASPMAHPVRPESYIEINNFYTVTVYEKGSEVIRMQHTLLGEAGFQKGMKLYVQRHDGKAVTIDDFVQAMEDANNRDLTQFKRWYSQSGTPEIKASAHYDNNILSLTLTQSCPATPGQPTKEPFHIPVNISLFDRVNGQKIAIPEKLLELTESTQTWTWENMSTQPIVSLLGGFSAPIKLHIEYTDAELQLLIQSEDDDFSRWESLQKIFYRYLFDQSDKASSVMLDIYRNILNNTRIDLLSKAELLTLPSFIECAQVVERINVDAIESGRTYWHETIGKTFESEFLKIYQLLASKSSAEMNAQNYAERRFKNTCLSYLIHAKNPEAKQLLLSQLKNAKNMTDETAALMGLMHIDTESKSQALDIFYQKWHHDDLVMDKWFTAQAISTLPFTTEHVSNLLEHSSFDKKNPNKVKALLGAFWMNNPRAFHSLDGSGYNLFVHNIMAFDKYNSFISAALARSMINWRQFDNKHQHLMQNALKAILHEKCISKDLYEIVSKSVDA
jgi:aminopeptidase N